MGRPKGGTNRYYSKEAKLRIVDEVGAGKGSNIIGAQYGIAATLVRKWVKQYREGGEEALVPKRKPGNPLAGYTNKKSPSEVEQLRYELALAHREIARLKKVRGKDWGDAPAKK